MSSKFDLFLQLKSTEFLQHFKTIESSSLNIELITGNTEPAVVQIYAGATKENIMNKIMYDLTECNNKKFCIISHAISPDNFYIQRKTNRKHLEFITQTLQTTVPQFTNLQNAKSGDLGVAFSTEDDLYYRAKVLNVVNAGFEVQLIDYGNIITVNKLYELAEELKVLPALAEQCKLDGQFDVKFEKEVLDTQFTTLVELHFGEVFEIETEEKDDEENVLKLKLLINFENMFECLTKAMETDQTIALRAVLNDCAVVHINSPKDFYIHLSEDLSELEKITDFLLDAERDLLPFADAVTAGTICAALFPEDGVYYRARIIQQLPMINEQQYRVHYIDFGNEAVTDQIRQLPPDMQNVNGIAQYCTLHGLREPLSLAACEQFQALVDSRFSETFQVEFLRRSVQPMICNLFYQQRNIAAEITELLNKNAEIEMKEDVLVVTEDAEEKTI